MVRRTRLTERLNDGLHRKLTLISAPAGFGKTTLASDWLAACGRRAAWLSLGEADDDPARFLAYLVAALQTITSSVGEGVLALFQSFQPPPIESLLTALLNEITTLADPIVLVLDDYHLIDARPIDQALTFLLEHLPPQLHLVITTREDPQLPLARLRARGQLTELRAADLRFTASEAALFLNDVMGLGLSAQDIAALEDRTEGWIAGLQLAALSMQGHEDVPGFIRTFAGDNQYIVDYLVEEVLFKRQPEPVRRFLLETSILDRLHGPLCDAVTGQQGGQARLEALERGNFFVVPLDDQRHWYRYHHLFADVLSARLVAEEPDRVPTLHRRASEWYERHDLAEGAIPHSLAAGDFERAADLIERALPEMRRNRQEVTVLGWLRALPDALVQRRPVLSAGYAAALLASGEFDGVEARLRDAERWLDTTTDARERSAAPSSVSADSAGMVVVDQEEFRRLPGTTAIYRAGLAHARGDAPDAVSYARRALELLPEDDDLWRGAAAALLGLASWASGDLELAHRMLAEGMARLRTVGHVSDAMGCSIALADIRIAQGRLRDAMSTYEQGLRVATGRDETALRGTADMHVGMSEVYRERDDLRSATEHLQRSEELGERAGLPQNRYRGRVAMARIREAQGDLEGALDLLEEAELLYVSDLFPNVRPVAAMKARVWAKQRRVGEAIGWARERGLSAKDDPSYLREFEHITLARVLLLARHSSDQGDHSPREDSSREAMGLLERLLRAAREGERTGSTIEILVLQALGHQAQGNLSAALASLERALTLAEPEGYVRIFVDQGPPMSALLEEAAKHGIAPSHVRRLLTALGKAEDRTPLQRGLIEPLSERERDVLRLLGSDLSGPDIARELVVSLNTVRTHTKSIYAKLGVNTRRAAIRRAAELQLL